MGDLYSTASQAVLTKQKIPRLKEIVTDYMNLLLSTAKEIREEYDDFSLTERKPLLEFISKQHELVSAKKDEHLPATFVPLHQFNSQVDVPHDSLSSYSICHSESDLVSTYEMTERTPSSSHDSVVYLCTRKSDGKKCAAKQVNEKIGKDALGELKKLALLDQDKSIVKYFGLVEGIKSAIIIMELCGGDVDQLIRCKKCKRESKEEKCKEIKPIDQQEGTLLDVDFLEHFDINAIEIMRQTVDGIKYLHSYLPAVVHGDIKPSNLLLYKHQVNGIVIKVSNFGLGRTLQRRTTAAGALSSMAPECKPSEKDTLTRASDIFSLGLTFFYILTEGFHVCDEKVDPLVRQSKICQKKTLAFHDALPRGRVRSYTMKGVTDEHLITACAMLKKMLKFVPTKRPDIDGVAAHPTFWSSKKKIDFLRNVYDDLNKKEAGNMDLDQYKKNLIADDQSGLAKFSIKRENISKAFRDNYDICLGENLSVTELLRIMRNKKSYGKLTAEERQELGMQNNHGKVNQIDWNKFFDAFFGEVPQLLVHVYEKLKNGKMQGEDCYSLN